MSAKYVIGMDPVRPTACWPTRRWTPDGPRPKGRRSRPCRSRNWWPPARSNRGPCCRRLPICWRGAIGGLRAGFALGAPRTYAVGELARRLSAKVPDRTVGVAKSWLAYSRVDRRQPILPWGGAGERAEDIPRDGLPAVPGAPGSGLGGGLSGRAGGPAEGRAHGASLLRRRCAGTHSRGAWRPGCPRTSCSWKSRRPPSMPGWPPAATCGGGPGAGRRAPGLRRRRRHHGPDARHRRRGRRASWCSAAWPWAITC